MIWAIFIFILAIACLFTLISDKVKELPDFVEINKNYILNSNGLEVTVINIYKDKMCAVKSHSGDIYRVSIYALRARND